METDGERSGTQNVPINRDVPGCRRIGGDSRSDFKTAALNHSATLPQVIGQRIDGLRTLSGQEHAYGAA